MPAYGNFVLQKGQKPASGQTFTKFRAVKPTTTADEVTPTTTLGEAILGVAQYGVTTTEASKGKKVSVRTDGITEWEAAAAVNRGVEVTTAADGRCQAAATGHRVHGIALMTASGAGARIAVQLRTNGRVV